MSRTVYKSPGVTLVMDPASIVAYKTFKIGRPVDRFHRRTAEAVAAAARATAPVGTEANSGRLKRSIHVRPRRVRRTPFHFGYEVVADAPYAYYVHEGTKPRPRDTYPGMMRFEGTNAWAGTIIMTHHVNHPGTPANDFLARALSTMIMAR